MKYAIVYLAITLGGCVPVIQYRMIENRLSNEEAKRKDVEKRIGLCEDQNKKLRESLKQRPVGSVIHPTELEEIKKKALEDATGKFKKRLMNEKQN